MLHVWFDLAVFVFSLQPERIKAFKVKLCFLLSAFHKRLSSKNCNGENRHEEKINESGLSSSHSQRQPGCNARALPAGGILLKSYALCDHNFPNQLILQRNKHLLR